ncbi:MAG TPA: NYN domain-containing protein [Vicinamibacterales bacterium]|nr:NYN domain-containing protein [Vicinamibacterales bacterium]
MTPDSRLKLAVFIDFDNIEIGVKNTLNASFDAGIVLEALKERGDVVSKTAYSDWQRAAGGHSRGLTQHAIKMVQRNLTPGGDKNGADINLALDALEMAFTHPHINAFVIVGGDSDFISLVEKLKQYDKKVFVVGGRQFTSGVLQRNCHEFIAYENLLGAASGQGAGDGGRHRGRQNVPLERVALDQAVPLVQRALAVLTEREVSPQLGLLKSTLLQLDSTFSERNYGAGSFRDFVEKLAKIGALSVYQGKGGWLVGPADGAMPAPEPATEDADGPRPSPVATPAPGTLGTQPDGVRAFRELLGSAQIRRWPMYLRNVKQVFRQATPAFDERAYGFANLLELLRAAQKEGVVRVDRDRQGVIRVFQATPAAAPIDAAPAPAVEAYVPDIPMVLVTTETTEARPTIEVADEDLSVGPGNVEQPPFHEPARRRARTPAARRTPQRRPRKKEQSAG